MTCRSTFKLTLCSQGSYLLAASNDFASRIWTVDDNRLRVSFLKAKQCSGYFCLAFPVLSNRDMAILQVGHLQKL